MIGIIVQIVPALLVFIGLILTFIQLVKNNKLRKQDFYTKLELASIDLFKLEIENPELIKLFEENIEEEDLSDIENYRLEEFAASLLNLFEIHYRLRKTNDIDPVIFASWIPWIYEASLGKYFREIWKDSRFNYDPNFREFLNCLIEIIENPDIENKEDKFYEKASQLIGCSVIRDWKKEPKKSVRNR
ncbi:MAG: hypothetical protein ACE5IW_05435 [bacterium]